MNRFVAVLALVAGPILAAAQTYPTGDPVIRRIWSEAMDSSQLPLLAHQLLDVIGPRLTGSPQLLKANDWLVRNYRSWGIQAENQRYGTWRGWERGITHIDLLKPRVRTLEGTMLAWSPSTGRGGVTASLVILPDAKDSSAFRDWLPRVRNKFVLVSMPEPTGRPDADWNQYATKESQDSMSALRHRIRQDWEHRYSVTGVSRDSLALLLENAGASGVFISFWSGGWGTYRVFGTQTRHIPVCELSLEDYTLLYRLEEGGDHPQVRVVAESKTLDTMPVYNTIGRMDGSAKKNEYVMLSAHLDSWDAAEGATDNGTGTLIMTEAMRVLSKVYPHPLRTVIVGHWSGEEQGLNGSRAYVQDHPEIVQHLQALFNQDNGTGRVVSIGAGGLLDAGAHLARWLSRMPTEIADSIRVGFPGMPATGGTDHASFDAAGAPGFGLRATSWNYFSYTWHTNRDTYDKLVFDDLKRNVVLVACLVYLASEDPEFIPRERRVMPTDRQTGKQADWPKEREPLREYVPGKKAP